MNPAATPKYLLIQARDKDDPIRRQEVACFAQAAACEKRQFTPFDILAGVPSREFVSGFDCVFIGGSGRYSAIGDEPWLLSALEFLRVLVDIDVPVFASCWGFQALARALGGEVVRDPACAEIGTNKVSLTEAGRTDPVLGDVGETFLAAMGHNDSVKVLPPLAVLLAKTDAVAQCYRLKDRMVYATQFHPELTRETLLDRVREYPEYIQEITGQTWAEFEVNCSETPQASSLIRCFIDACEEVARQRDASAKKGDP